MLVAITTTATRTPAEDAVRGERYLCPACREEVVLRQGERVVWHFAHRAGAACRHGEGESPRHLEMKAKVRKRLVALGLTVDYEVRVDLGRRHRIADLVVDDPAIGRYAIECQVSAMNGREYADRVRFYNEAGLPVLVLWDHFRAIRRTTPDRYARRDVFETEPGVEYKVHGGVITAAEAHGVAVHYTLAEPQEVDDDGVLRALHLLPGTERPAAWRTTHAGEQWVEAYVPKFRREAKLTDRVPWQARITQTRGGLRIVRLGEPPIHAWATTPAPQVPEPAAPTPVTLPLFDTSPWHTSPRHA